MTKQYIVLAAYGFRSKKLVRAASLRLTSPLATGVGGQVAVANPTLDKADVVSAISIGHPKLVEMASEAGAGLEDELSAKLMAAVPSATGDAISVGRISICCREQ